MPRKDKYNHEFKHRLSYLSAKKKRSQPASEFKQRLSVIYVRKNNKEEQHYELEQCLSYLSAEQKKGASLRGQCHKRG